MVPCGMRGEGGTVEGLLSQTHLSRFTLTYEIIFLLVTNFNMIMIIHEVYAVWGLHI